MNTLSVVIGILVFIALIGFYVISIFNKLVMHSVETLQRIARFGKSGVSVLKVKKSSL